MLGFWGQILRLHAWLMHGSFHAESSVLERRGKSQKRCRACARRAHPRWVLERHIGRYWALAPNTPVAGWHRGETYYERSALQELHTVRLLLISCAAEAAEPHSLWWWPCMAQTAICALCMPGVSKHAGSILTDAGGAPVFTA
jgi:hypothetical protein